MSQRCYLKSSLKNKKEMFFFLKDWKMISGLKNKARETLVTNSQTQDVDSLNKGKYFVFYA